MNLTRDRVNDIPLVDYSGPESMPSLGSRIAAALRYPLGSAKGAKSSTTTTQICSICTEDFANGIGSETTLRTYLPSVLHRSVAP